MAIQGLGKTLYRENKRHIASYVKGLIADLKAGYDFTPYDVEAAFEQIMENFRQDLEDNDAPNQDLWLDRLQADLEKETAKLEEKYPGVFEDIEYVEDAEDESNIENPDDEPVDDIEGGYIDINGTPVEIISDDQKAYFRAMGYVRRSITIPSVEELQEYAKDIPYIMGIEVVYEGGYFEGFTVWIEYN